MMRQDRAIQNKMLLQTISMILLPMLPTLRQPNPRMGVVLAIGELDTPKGKHGDG
jgi:hypothetical protein